MDHKLADVSAATTATTCPDKPIYEIVVDPDMAHLGESFVIDMRKTNGNTVPQGDKMDFAQRSNIANNLKKMANKQSSTSQVSRVGRAISTINEIDHAHPANPVPTSNVGPPQVKVFFDMPGLGSISFRYHKVITLKDQIVFMTDKRFGGNAEFYPYCNIKSGETKKPVGVYVEGDNRLLLLDPTIPGFPIKFECEPYEFCIVPVGSAKGLNSAMMQELGIVNSSGKESTNGEESSDRGGLNPPESGARLDPGSPADGDYESVEGGLGGVL
jgi:hypothetical protein